MKKSIIIFFALFLVLSLFADKVPSNYEDFEYVNKDGSLDWATFYAEWDTIPDSYYMYLTVYTSHSLHGVEPHKMLAKSMGGIMSDIYAFTHDNDICYIYRVWARKDFYYDIELIFSPWNFQNTKDIGWVPLGQKRYNYKDAIERWKFTINQY